MAIVCSDAAKRFVELEPDFIIVGPLVGDSDVLLKRSEEVKVIGITQDKDYLEKLVRQKYGDEVEFIPMIVQSLPYALERGLVDSIAIDISRLGELEGVVENLVGDVSTYMLVSRLDFLETEEFQSFRLEYNKAVEKLNSDPEILKNQMVSYSKLGQGRMMDWKVKLEKIR